MGGHQAGHATPTTTAMPAGVHASSSNMAIGAEVGFLDPPSGSTVMPTAVAPLASPSRSTVWFAASGIVPAGTITPSFWSQSS